MKKVFVTGATGLIGRESIWYLLEKNFEIYVLSRRNSKNFWNSNNKKVNFVEADLFDKTAMFALLREIRPEYLLHFAWLSTGKFKDNINFEFLSASLELLNAFGKNGGKRAVMAGTYAEYGYKSGILSENMLAEPINIYSECKDFLRQVADKYCENNGISFAWGRIFSAFGCESDQRRLTAYVINNLIANKEIVIKSGSLVRDYIYSKDVARAFVELLDKDINGIINICSGKGTTIRDYVMKIAKLLDKEDKVQFKEQESNEQKIVIGDNFRLKNELKFELKYSLETGLAETIEYQKNKLKFFQIL